MSSESGGGEVSVDTTRYAALRHQLATMDTNSHLALFYQSRESQHVAAAAFLDIGLQNDEKCLYIYDESGPATLDAQFRRVGIDVDAHRDAGSLQFVDGREFYLGEGFDPDRMIADLEVAAAEALNAGYSGLRVLGENTWSFELEETFDSIIEFEASFDRDCSSVPAQTLCQYNLRRFDESAIIKALRTHEHIIYRDTLCENPYYVPPEQYLDATDPETNAVAALEQTYELSESRRAIRSQQQRLEVINRIFRHNIRNDMNVLLNHLEYLDEEGLVAEQARDKLVTMQETLREFIEMSERARYIEQTLQESHVTAVDLSTVVTDAVEGLRSEYPAAEFDVDAAPSLTVVADEHIGVAVEELCRNAAVHSEADPPTVDVALTTAETPGSALLTVENDGTIPDSIRQAITTGAETPLQHSNGLGLWVVKWLVEQSHGELSLVTEGQRCRVQVQLPTTADGSLGTD